MTPWTKLSKEECFSEDIEMKLSEYGIADDCKVVVPATPVSDLDPVVFLLHEEFTRPGGCSRIDRHTRHMYDIVKMKYGFIYKDAPTYRQNTLQQTFRQLDCK